MTASSSGAAVGAPEAQRVGFDPARIPAGVADLAAAHHLGPFCDARVVRDPLLVMLIGVLVGAASWGLAVVGVALEVPLLVVPAPFGILAALAAIGYGVSALVHGTGPSWYLFDGGVVVVRRRGLRAVRWEDVASATRMRVGLARSRISAEVLPESVRGYRLLTADGARHLLVTTGRLYLTRHLAEHLEDRLVSAGVPVDDQPSRGTAAGP